VRLQTVTTMLTMHHDSFQVMHLDLVIPT